MNALIRKYLKSGVTLFALLDSCHSGTMLDLRYNYLDYSETPKDTDTVGNVILISGCKDNQTSEDAYVNNIFQGAMTWAFLGNLQPKITWRQLLTNMDASLAGSDYTQVPQLSSGKFIDLDSKFLFA